MSYLNPRSFYQEIAAGTTEYSYVNKYGENLNVSAAADEDVWITGGTMPWQTTAQSLEVLSGSASDKGTPAASTGALTLTVEGIDANWAAKTQTVTMDGTSVVALSGTWLRVNRMYVATAGTSTTNVGIITCRIASAGATQITIPVGIGQTLFAGWTCPTGRIAYVTQMWGGFTHAIPTSAALELKLWVRPAVDAAGAWRLQHIMNFEKGGTSETLHTFLVPSAYTGAADFRIAANASANSTLVSAGFSIIHKPA